MHRLELQKRIDNHLIYKKQIYLLNKEIIHQI